MYFNLSIEKFLGVKLNFWPKRRPISGPYDDLMSCGGRRGLNLAKKSSDTISMALLA